MNLFFGGSKAELIEAKIRKLETKKAKVEADPLHSKDDLIAFDLKIQELEQKLKEIKK